MEGPWNADFCLPLGGYLGAQGILDNFVSEEGGGCNFFSTPLSNVKREIMEDNRKLQRFSL